MRRNKPREYAEAFLSALRTADEAGKKHLARGLVDTAARRGEKGILPDVLSQVIMRIKKREEDAAVHIEVVDTAEQKREGARIKETLAFLGADDAPKNVSANPVLIGGFRIRYRGTIFDASHRTYLLDLYRRLTA